MDANEVGAISVALLAIALLLIGGLLASRTVAQMRSGRILSRALGERATVIANRSAAAAASASPASARTGAAGSSAGKGAAGADPAPGSGGSRGLRYLVDRMARLGLHWFDTRTGRQLVAAEDRLLIEQCGFVDARARGIFLMARVACAIGLPLVVSLVLNSYPAGSVVRHWVVLFFALSLGYMAPKWVLGRIAADRRQAVKNELPMLIDLLRLLQGVGLSIDQCVQVIVGEFRRVLPALGQELEIANRNFVTGRTREQSLQRLANTYDNDDLRAVVSLIVQVDKHGGAVQEPLKQFGERLREGRRTALRERIGKLTVKMTTVMITTLLPALLIVTAGPGFLAVTRSLAALAGRH
jgi:tight adherence protein C